MSKKKPTVAETINDPLDLVREFAPGLVVARASLLPFSDVIVEEHAGPQPDADDYDPDEEPYFAVTVDDAVYERCQIEAKVTAKSVKVKTWVTQPDGSVLLDEAFSTNLEGLWNFLRQLPRPPSSFLRR